MEAMLATTARWASSVCQAVTACGLAVRSQIIDEVAVVTIQPTRRGVRVFDPTAITVEWK
jgi:hypothetical protein